MSTESDQPWERQPDEPSDWFDRFERYRLLGPLRTIEEVWRTENESRPEAKRSKAKRPHSSWYEAVKRWNWEERAETWDDVERERRRKEQTQALAETRQRQVEYARTMQAKLSPHLQTAAIDDLSFVEADKVMRQLMQLELEALSGTQLDLLQQEVEGLRRQLKRHEKRRNCNPPPGQRNPRPPDPGSGTEPGV